MLCEMGALRRLCMELSFLKNLFTATVICRSELMFIYSSSCQKKKIKKCITALSSEALKGLLNKCLIVGSQ